MILRCYTFWSSLALANLLFILGVTAQDGTDQFNCRVLTNDLTYDLKPLQGEHTISRTRETPPSSMVDSVRFDICADLKQQDGVAAGDQVCGRPSANTRFQVGVYKTFVFRTVSCRDKSMPDEDEPKGRQLGPCGCRDTSCSIEYTRPKVFSHRS